jgi:hypothetical protein
MHTTMPLFLEIVGLTCEWMHLCFFDEMQLIFLAVMDFISTIIIMKLLI